MAIPQTRTGLTPLRRTAPGEAQGGKPGRLAVVNAAAQRMVFRVPVLVFRQVH